MEMVHENLQFYPPTEPSIPALDRFLTGQTHSLQLQPQMGSGGFSDEFFDLSNPWLFCDDPHEMMSESYNNSQLEQPPDPYGAMSKTSGRGTSGKRKWTEDEDRTLLKMVKQYGLKKWASIAQRLEEGRTAKQCRERWQNHLRPDIKKESWSEEEERMLIEAHEKVGNRWTEIARRIPGGTENSVKNHWNAAKRRRNLQVKKKASLPKPSSLLQDYMKRNHFYSPPPNNRPSQPTTSVVGSDKISAASQHHLTATSTLVEEWEEEYSPPLMADAVRDEEVMFMLNLFSSSHHQPHWGYKLT